MYHPSVRPLNAFFCCRCFWCLVLQIFKNFQRKKKYTKIQSYIIEYLSCCANATAFFHFRLYTDACISLMLIPCALLNHKYCLYVHQNNRSKRGLMCALTGLINTTLYTRFCSICYWWLVVLLLFLLLLLLLMPLLHCMQMTIHIYEYDEGLFDVSDCSSSYVSAERERDFFLFVLLLFLMMMMVIRYWTNGLLKGSSFLIKSLFSWYFGL